MSDDTWLCGSAIETAAEDVCGTGHIVAFSNGTTIQILNDRVNVTATMLAAAARP